MSYIQDSTRGVVRIPKPSTTNLTKHLAEFLSFSAMGQTSSSPTSAPVPSKLPESAPSCSVDHGKSTNTPPATCPVAHDALRTPTQCPINHDVINPLNQMPDLAQIPALNQKLYLPVERTESSIPRDASTKWDYPSPQQFYNALVRKGWETPEEDVETMVDIHNFLNERAWLEVLKWEKRSYV